MNKHSPKVILFLYNRLFDQVNQSNFWLYIKDYLINDRYAYKFHVVTYENSKLPLTTEQLELLNEWKDKGLKWTPLKWHQGTQLWKKLLDMTKGLFVVSGLRIKGYKHIVTLASVAGGFAYVYSKILRLKLFMYSFEPHSEYGVDNGMWTQSSRQYKITSYLEKKSAHFATVVASGTRFMEYRIKEEWKSNANFIKLPTVVDDQKFRYNEFDRKKIRKLLNISEGKQLLYYPGKFGNLYYSASQFACMFKWIREEDSGIHLLVVTPQDIQEVKKLFDEAGVNSTDYTITQCEYTDIQKFHSASDFAIISVPPGPSKKFISNIKVGEYLCAGLPFLITHGVSEDYIYANEKQVGVVVKDFTKDEVKKAYPKIKTFLDTDKKKLRQHCREVGTEYRGFKKLNDSFKKAMQILTDNYHE